MIKFTYCGFDSETDLDLIVTDIRRDVAPQMTEQVQDIPGMFGVAYEGISFGAKSIEIDCLMDVESEQERIALMRELGNLAVQTGDGMEYPLVLSDDPDVTWWVHPVEFSQPQRVGQTNPEAIITLKFSCSEGVGQGAKVTTPITTPTVTLTPIGTAKTSPVFTLTAGENLTHIGISNGEDYIYLGAGFDKENQDTAINQKPKILNDDCKSLSTWTKVGTSPTFSIENGKVAANATLKTGPNSIQADSFGTNPGGKGAKGWYGAAYQKFLTKELTDWEVYARFYVNNKYPRAQNKIELYLLDKSGKRIGKFMIKDNDVSLENQVQAQIGYASEGTSKEVFLGSRDGAKVTKKDTLKNVVVKATTKTTDSKGNTKTKTVSKSLNQSNATNTFTDFYGYITLNKTGNVYTATVQMLNKDGIETGTKFKTTYTDSKNQFGDKLSGIAVYMAKYDIAEDGYATPISYSPNTLELSHVNVYEIQGKTVQNVAETGDEIIIDCDNHRVYRNGVAYMEDWSIGSKFFSMAAKQPTALSISPEPSATNKWEVTYTPRHN